MKVLFFISAFMIFSSCFATGGGSVDLSGGGYGVSMKNQVFLLDFVESFKNADPHFMDSPKDNPWTAPVMQIFKNSELLTLSKPVSSKLQEIESLDPILAITIFNAMHAYTWSIVNSRLTLIDPVNTALDIKSVVQIAVRKGRTVYIDLYYWNQMNPVQKTGLIFHEVISSLLPNLPNSRERQIVSYFFNANIAPNYREQILQKIYSILPNEKYFFEKIISQSLPSYIPKPTGRPKLTWSYVFNEYGEGEVQFLPFYYESYNVNQSMNPYFRKEEVVDLTRFYFRGQENNLHPVSIMDSKIKNLERKFQNWFSFKVKFDFLEDEQRLLIQPKIKPLFYTESQFELNSMTSPNCLSLFDCKRKSSRFEQILSWLSDFK